MSYTLDDFKAYLKQDKQSRTYDELQAEYGVNRWYLWHIINTPGYEPPPRIAARLDIIIYKPAPICQKCGQVHTTKRCTAGERRKRMDWRAESVEWWERWEEWSKGYS